MTAVEIPLASCADEVLRRLARATGSAAIAGLTGATLLGERAMLSGMSIPGHVSAGGGCRLFDAADDTVALNLSRPSDRELLPALFEVDALDSSDGHVIAAYVARYDAQSLVLRGRSMGLAIAAEHESRWVAAGREVRSTGLAWVAEREGWPTFINPCVALAPGCFSNHRRARPRVVDLSALWAGPLASHLLSLAGAEVIKVESRTRPDAMRNGDTQFFTLLNQGKNSVVLDFTDPNDLQALYSLIATADIVIEASRPRALAQLGFDAAQIVGTTPGLVWITITGHGATGPAADWVGFGDDCSVAAGLSAALREATGGSGFIGDAIADPLTGIFAAGAAWDAWVSRRGGRIGIALSHVVAHCLARCREHNPEALRKQLRVWGASAGKPFPEVQRRNIGVAPAFADGERILDLIESVQTAAGNAGLIEPAPSPLNRVATC